MDIFENFSTLFVEVWKKEFIFSPGEEEFLLEKIR